MDRLSNIQITACKRRLSARQSKLIHQLKNRFDLEMSQTDAIGELSSYDNHPADMGTELFERGKDLALYDHAEQELEDINKALHALAEGTYGICRVCSASIPYDRLVANPTADTCVEHADGQQINIDQRPIEEEVLGSHINPEPATDEATNFYDREDAWQDVARYGTSDTPADLFGDHESYDEMYANSDEQIGVVEAVEKYPDDR